MADKGPKDWPHLWSANWTFVTDSNGSISQHGGWWYNWDAGLLREDNLNGGCLYFPGIPCTVIFKANNIYVWHPVLEDPTAECCVLHTDIGPTPPNYLNDSTFQGNESYKWESVPSSKWYHESTGETYYQTLETQIPAALSGEGTTIVW
eukprot:CAMPEP_0174267650 /NCGR_PEP_ID=MMETSP0439-20130205/34421_1 /TAXON_ID=0 /ORGANISM="Stereomyxa ramosa, Strain Chinc5" /LENGTH=148 /DNA_ID=CAMNT_0015355265 /DNA_START=66 /DNA_END=509 /DNA_ORIENTATION=+